MKVVDGRLIYDNGVDCGAVYQEVDGYYVFWPNEGQGFYDEGFLYRLAELLHEMNKPWDDEVQEYFKTQGDTNVN